MDAPQLDRRPAKLHALPSPPPSTAGIRPWILLADCNADAHAIYGAFLEAAGYALVHAYSAAECLRLARSLRPVAAVVSVGRCGVLPRTSYRVLASAARSAGFPILCITTDSRCVDEADRRVPGASAVLMLPCEPPDLVDELVRALRELRVN